SDFLRVIAEEFSRVLYESLRKFDKYHMILGSRPSRDYPEVLEAIGKYTDIFGTHHVSPGYKISPKFYEVIDTIYEHTEKPVLFTVLITGQDVGLPHGMLRTQKDRGISYWRYLAKVAQDPRVVAVHWFQYFDPPEKCYDANAANWGLVNDQDEPYEEAVKLIFQANNMVYAYAMGLSDFSPEFDGFFRNNAAATKIPQGEMAKAITLPIANADFEKGRSGWALQTWKGKSKASIDSSVRYSGKMALKLEGGNAEGWDSVAVAVQSDLKFSLKPGYQYKLSAWVKTENVENFAFVRIKVKNASDESKYFSTTEEYGTEDWRLVEATFTPMEENKIDYLALELVGKGMAWFDDIRLEVMGSQDETSADFAKTRADEVVAVERKKVVSTLNLTNPGFEDGETGWKFQTWKGKPKVGLDGRIAHSGKRSVKIVGSADGWDSVGVAAKGDISFKLAADTDYRLSGWVKTDSIEDFACIKIKAVYEGGEVKYFETPSLAGTNEWQEMAIDFKPQKDCTIEYLACQLVGRGTAWFDDISLEEIE
ncbi:MAG: carbohydrate binding domain-containing protein, partial [Candidatus Omnitrophica bacterium]|nr:carbohydrate binding domain-containing protein [Candidatus Omnitrophota bacterium]